VTVQTQPTKLSVKAKKSAETILAHAAAAKNIRSAAAKTNNFTEN
jgi:hypothetical protein